MSRYVNINEVKRNICVSECVNVTEKIKMAVRQSV